MTRAFAFASYVYQSAAAIVLIVCVSHLVAPATYTAFSLTLASAQFAGVLAFEWVQIAGTRYLSSATPATGPRLRVALLAADGGGALALAAAAGTLLLAAPALAPDRTLVLLGLGIAAGQGLTDLALTMVRVDGRLGRAAALMVLRASALVTGTVAGAWLDGSARGALAGNLAGHAVGLAAALATAWGSGLFRGASPRLDRADLARFARFGVPAAAASVTHLTVPIAIRYLIVGLYAANPAVAAAASLALDLLQRPFSVLIAAIHIVSYPEVVAAHDRGGPDAARAAAARLLEFMLCATTIMLGGLVAFLPEAAALLVRPELRADFVGVGAAATAFYFLHVQIQTTLAIVPQLREATARLVGVAAAQLATVAGLVWAGVGLGAAPRDALLLACFATAAVALYAVRPTLAFGARPRGALVAAAVAGAGLIAATALPGAAGPLWLGLRIALSAGIVAGIAWAGDFLHLRRPNPPAPQPLRPRRPRQPARGSARSASRLRAERSQA
ncbi:hypothetical protein Q8W71_04025 [Methylobacterium sp. NEAU 140]|uniref:hypothetical protein n=1 Tax=Methylobacterium sp. NEAU 140 TaxID=3064945 RepID=UPI002733D5DF|nr:hypothetical protein [Methylobacterium sp. NEAU 140]MDP4021784.1 hypothetical protein [Methylobacterium sp. NEAU 140]